MAEIKLRPQASCRWDAVALGEIMLRFDPGDTRVKTARTFTVWEGGGEYNVIRGLRKCFRLTTSVLTGIPRTPLGYLLEDLICQGGVDLSHAVWFPYDGIGGSHRQGLNFVEKGFGLRGAVGVSDRAHTAASAVTPEDFDFEKIFLSEGSRWFHCGGIFAALSESSAETAIAAMKAARSAGTIVSYDLNYRPSLWKSRGGQEKARAVNREIVKYVDVIIGNEEDFSASLGFQLPDVNTEAIQKDTYKQMMQEVQRTYPELKAVATTLREVHSANFNDWGALLYYDGEIYESVEWENMEIFDRVGGGDSFASGLVYGFLSGRTPQECVNLGAAHGALAMTTPGDTSMASVQEVEALATGGSARIVR
jgi:2-dehydro-3-deoxygluconokinase